MACMCPSMIVNERYKRDPFLCTESYPADYYLLIPCGVCVNCRKKRSSEWRFRMLKEYEYGCLSTKGYRAFFVTLTFDEDHLPDNIKADDLNERSVVARYIKRFRDNYRKRRLSDGLKRGPLRYAFFTELGDKKGRLHLHGILFNPIFDTPITSETFKSYVDVIGKRHFIDKDGSHAALTEELQRYWKNGNVWIDVCTPSTINYIVKYLRKPSAFDPLYKPLSFVSNGLGKAYVDDPLTMSQVRNADGSPRYVVYQSDGIPVALPRYYTEKLFTSSERYLSYLKSRLSGDKPPPRRIGDCVFDDESQFYESSLYYVDSQPVYPRVTWCTLDALLCESVMLFGDNIDKTLMLQDVERLSNIPVTTLKYLKTKRLN